MINEILEIYRRMKVICTAWTEGIKTDEAGFVEKVREVAVDLNDLLNAADDKAIDKKEEEEKKDEG